MTNIPYLQEESTIFVGGGLRVLTQREPSYSIVEWQLDPFIARKEEDLSICVYLINQNFWEFLLVTRIIEPECMVLNMKHMPAKVLLHLAILIIIMFPVLHVLLQHVVRKS